MNTRSANLSKRPRPEDDEDIDEELYAMDGQDGREEGSGSSVVPAFLTKTFEIMENPEFEPFVTWNEQGDGIVVKKV